MPETVASHLEKFTKNEKIFSDTPNSEQGQTATPGIPCRTLFDKTMVSLLSPTDHNYENDGDGAYGLSSLSEKTRMSNHPKCWSGLGLEPSTSRTVVRRSTK